MSRQPSVLAQVRVEGRSGDGRVLVAACNEYATHAGVRSEHRRIVLRASGGEDAVLLAGEYPAQRDPWASSVLNLLATRPSVLQTMPVTKIRPISGGRFPSAASTAVGGMGVLGAISVLPEENVTIRSSVSSHTLIGRTKGCNLSPLQV